ncbi:hypothetical protein AAVH_22037 [Aphelenchoides avenae]|nr:hypothetical protein AAVH_22037 [Aphelenchus avenae]
MWPHSVRMRVRTTHVRSAQVGPHRTPSGPQKAATVAAPSQPRRSHFKRKALHLVKKEDGAPSSSSVPSEDELDVGEPSQQQFPPADAVEEVIYVEAAAPDARMEQLLGQLEKHLAVDGTPNVHMGHALGQRMDRNIPVEMQDDAWAAIFGVLKEFEEKAKRVAAPNLAEATGNDSQLSDNIGEGPLSIDEDA